MFNSWAGAEYKYYTRETMYIPTANSYFSSVGGLDLGVQEAGVKILQSLDIDTEACNIMRANTHYFSHSIVNADISKVTVLDQPEADVHLYTYPCTKYSAIADIHGTRTGDELYLHSLRHTALHKPEMYVMENVPGMRKFPIVMEAMTRLPDYYVTVICPVSATNWLPQKRDRLIIFATLKPFTPSHPKRAQRIPRIADIVEENAPVVVTKSMRNRMAGQYRDLPIIVDPNDYNALSPTVVAHYHKDYSTRVLKDNRSDIGVRAFTIREWARLQGFPDDYHFPDKVSSYKHIGNAVPRPMGRWVGEQIIKYFNQVA